MPAIITKTTLVDQLGALGVQAGGVLLVHASYRAIRPVESGPAGVIDALRAAVGSGGTLVMPSWSDDDSGVFDPSVTPAGASLGVIADTFWRVPGARRSAHPFAFAALGPLADAITADPLPLPPHGLESPVGRVYELDGRILLLGVGHDANTTIHLAEVFASVPYSVTKHCTVLADGRPTRLDYAETDHCCQRFALADEWLRRRNLQREGPIGRGQGRLIRSRDTVSAVRDQLEREPLIFLHPPEAGCGECDEARRSVYDR
jgi:aminoglycoside 3-N-acetyltransferase-4